MISNLPIFPEAASTLASEVDALFFFLLGVSAFFGLLIATLVIGFAIRYRRRSENDLPKPIHGSLQLELAWTIIPFALSMVMFFWGASLFVKLSRPPDDALEVFVVGKQWMWKLQHMEGRREINELHVPVGSPVKLTMTSEDVIHSFYVPAFRIKADVVPGRYTTTWFEATKPGTYHLFCAEYCGTSHSRMIGSIVVQEPAEYQAWLSGAAEEAVAVAAAGPQSPGEKLFNRFGCATCHRAEAGSLGPSLTGVFGSTVKLQSGEQIPVDDAYLHESIIDPLAKIVDGYKPVMPTFRGQISEDEIFQLIQYIKTLKQNVAEAGIPAAQG